jgi:hypothetical protein
MIQVTKAEVPEVEPLESYVIVQKDDVLEAIGTFVAAYLAQLPEAQNLQPAQLQAALKTTFKVTAALTSLVLEGDGLLVLQCTVKSQSLSVCMYVHAAASVDV